MIYVKLRILGWKKTQAKRPEANFWRCSISNQNRSSCSSSNLKKK